MMNKTATLIFAVLLLHHPAMPVLAQTQLARTDQDSESYKDLIQKNFDLRKRLSDLEEKYFGLENDRKTLILHVKDLQQEKGARNEMIQELKNMIASLRIEMLKDPQLTKTIDGMNQKIKELTAGRDAAQEALDKLREENEAISSELGKVQKAFSDEQKLFEQLQAENATALQTAQAKIEELTGKLDRSETGPTQYSVKIEASLEEIRLQKEALAKDNERIKNALSETKGLLEKAQASLSRETARAEQLEQDYIEKTRGVTQELAAVRKQYEEARQALSTAGQSDGMLLKEWKDKAKRFENERNEAQVAATRLEEEIKQLESSSQALTKSLSEARKALEEKERALAQAREGSGRDEESLRRKISKMEDEKKDIARERDLLIEKARETQVMLQTAQAALKAEMARTQEMEHKYAPLAKDATLVEKVKIYEEDSKIDKAKNKELVKTLNEVKASHAKQEKEMLLAQERFGQQESKIKASLEKLRIENEAWAEKNRSGEKKLEETRRALAVLTKEKEAGEGPIKEEMRRLEKDQSRLENEIAKNGQDLRARDEEIRKLKLALKEANTMTEVARNEIKKRVSEWSREREELAKALDTARKEQAGYVQETALLKDKLTVLEKEKIKEEKERKELTALLEESEKSFQAKMKAAMKENEQHKTEAEKSNYDLRELRANMALLKEQITKNQKANKQLMIELTQEKASLDVAKKDFRKEQLKNEFEREHYQEQLKMVKADKAMVETRVEQAQERALAAETRLDKIKRNLEDEAAKAMMQESQIASLEEEKARLEEQLLKYVETVMESGTGARDNRRWEGKTGAGEKWMPAPEIRSKKEIAGQKLKMHYNLALTYDQRKMYREEEKEYHKCLKINPRDANVHYNLAILYDDKLQRKDKAIYHYKKYIEYTPSEAEVDKVKRWILHAEQEQRLGK